MEMNPNLSRKAMQDCHLVELARNGNQGAYAELLERYRDAIYFMLLKMVNNKNDAEDLTIEAFGKAFRNLGQYSPSFAFSTWLFKIATNNCIDFLRKRRSDILSLDAPIDSGEYEQQAIPVASDTLDPEEIIIKEQKYILMNQIVQKLKPRYRKLIELRYFREFSYEEIAAELELPIGTVKAQLFRARELLYQIIKSKQDNL
jgi:RNA polymerase sigma-70 factor (ECF subfamily)